MFSAVNCFQMFKSDSVNGRRGTLQIQTREPNSEASEQHQTLLTWLEMTKADTVFIKNMQSNKINIIQHKA